VTPEQLAEDVAQYKPPDIPLRLQAAGPGSRPDIVDYVRSVIEQRTAVNGDTTADRVARALVTSILHRLGAGHSVACGFATVALVPTDEALARCEPTA
jgi:acetyl-CoA carboxylase alpha subunit